MTGAFFFIFALHVTARPYDEDKNPWANELESFLLFWLAILGIVQFISSSNTRITLSRAIVGLTYGIAGVYMIVKAVIYMLKK